MDGQSTSVHLSSRPDLLNIDKEFAVNLQILLGNGQSKAPACPKISNVSSSQKNDHGSDIDSVTSSSTASSRETRSVPSLISVPAFRYDYDLNLAPEANLSTSNVDTDINSSVDQNKTRAFHTTFFQGKVSDPVVLDDHVKVPVPVLRSKSMGKRNMSARIQSLLENFESSGSKFDPTLSSLPEVPRGIEKRPARQSPEASLSEKKASAEACFVCNKVIYPLDRYSTGSHVYHKGCLKCSICDRNLSSITCESSGDKLFCRPHFLEKAHGIFRRISTPAKLSCDRQTGTPHSITVE